MTTGKRRLSDSFLHLGLGATAVPQPPFEGGMDWYEGYGQRHGSDGREGRLVSQHSFSEDWDSWEMHPHGEEVVICTKGSMVLTQEFPDGRRETLTLEVGEYAINPAGVWHIADVESHATAIFITAGEGTQHRPR
ncbi:cupin domain-containing protein [Qipengyuania seohaensis]|uniref:cupin domain-containing protein n=1 Tax=Qipengyuania seohaensis TaxID=266951 RepID=UPI000C22828E|nr:cupin domain-containing protein [Qipengyuania seohaensis]